ncbi:MAG: sialidase family protein [Armatimonadota bacterium]
MIEKFTISRDDSTYECFPDVCLTDTGRLIITYRESDSHSAGEYTHLLFRTSDDEGRTWSEKTYIAHSEIEGGELFKWNCPRISQLSDGRILLICDGFIRRPGDVDSRAESTTWIWTSSDDGESFSDPVDTGIPGIVPDQIVELSSGRLLLATHRRLTDMAPNIYQQMVHISDDGGDTWRGPVTVCCTHHYDACEASIVQMPGGEVVCYMRDNSRTGRPGPKCISLNDGEDWLGPFDTPMNGCHRPVSGITASGHVMVLYRHQPGRGPFAKNLFAYQESVDSALSPPREEQTGVVLPLDHDSSDHSDSSYCGWVELQAGRFFVVNYINDDAPMAQIRGMYFTEDEF